ncbi:MAG: 4Fe-4S dicluster domain-containing protein [Planctomycetota bacterium]
MQRTLIITPDRCTACRTCELACSFKHQDTKGPGMSRIRAFMKSEGRNMILTCFQCDEAACVKVCPVAALQRSEETGAIEVNVDRCIRCNACAAACPFGHMDIDRNTHIAIKCDLCKGEPACATFCPTRTLEYK